MTEPLRLPGTMPEPTPQIIALYNLYGLYTNGKGVQRDRAHTALATIHNLLDLADLGNFKVEPADGTEPEFISAVIARQSIVLREVAHCIASTERKRQEAIAAIACALGFLQKDEPLSDRARRQTEQTLATWGYQL